MPLLYRDKLAVKIVRNTKIKGRLIKLWFRGKDENLNFKKSHSYSKIYFESKILGIA